MTTVHDVKWQYKRKAKISFWKNWIIPRNGSTREEWTFLLQHGGCLFGTNIKQIFYFQVEANDLDVMESMCEIWGQLCAALVVNYKKRKWDSKGYRGTGLLLCLEKFNSIVQRPVRFDLK